MNEEELRKAKEYNIKLYPFYKMVSWDLLFYYSIIYLFLTQVKGLSTSTILFGDAFYPLSKVIFQIPFVTIVDKIGKRKSVFLGNICLVISILILIIFPGLPSLIISNIMSGAGFTLKGLCETAILDECILDKEKKRTIFSKLDGRGNSFWYFLDAIAAVTTGFLFVVNAYLPMIISLICSIISCILSYKFKPYENLQLKSKKDLNETKNYLRQLKFSFKYIFKSSRLRNLILFAALFSGLLGIRTTLTSSLLTDLNIPRQFFGIVFAILGISASISSKHQDFFHHKYKNRVLTHFAIPYCITLIICGAMLILNANRYAAIVVIFIMFILQNIIKGPYHTLIYRYLNSFSAPDISTKIYSANALLEGIFRFFITLLASFLLDTVSTSYSLIIIGCIFMIIFVLLLDYMKNKVGLKPEEYKKSDIEFTFVK